MQAVERLNVCIAYVTGQGTAGHHTVAGRMPAGSQATGFLAPRIRG